MSETCNFCLEPWSTHSPTQRISCERETTTCWACGTDLGPLDPIWEPICLPCFAVVRFIQAFTITPDLAAPAA